MTKTGPNTVAVNAISEEMFLESWQDLAVRINENARAKGFWQTDGSEGMVRERSFGECIALLHSELSEALEAWRHHNPESEKLPGFTQIEEELADVAIRLMDTALHFAPRTAEAVIAKHEFNVTRSFRHGGKAL